MTRYKHLLVDLDGTLLGSRDLSLRWGFITAVAREIRKHEPGVGFFRSLRALRAMRLTLEASGGAVCNEIRASDAFGHALGIPSERARKLLNEIVHTTFPQLEAHFFPIHGAVEFIDWARSRFSLHLATNPVWPRGVVELRLGWAGIDPGKFNFIAHAGVMHACKPSLDYYRELLGHLKVDASECLMIGDSARKDLPASEIGIPVFLLGRQGGFPELRSFLESS